MNRVLLLISITLLILYFIPTYTNPKIIKTVLTKDECDHIKQVASKKLHASTVSKSRNIDETIRKSETAWIKTSEDPVVDKLIRKCVSMTDRPLSNCEDLQVLKYEPGGFYKPHQDAFPDDKNKRMYTFIIALNDEYEGGETVFPNINKSYRLEKGDVLFFNALNNYECMTKKALHGGASVKSGEKWICNLWVRKYAY
jgi:hypothetical protein